MPVNLKNITLSAVFISFSAGCFSQALTAPVKPAFKRQYKTGDVYRYKLTLNEYKDGKLQFINISVCELHVVDSNRTPYDEVKWLSKKVVRGNDTLDQTAIAQSARPYRITLAGFGIVNMPRIDKPEMTEPLEDFNTFFVAISPGLYMMGRRFALPGDSVRMGSAIKANFANGANIPKGEDCLAISIKIVGSTQQETHIRTSFMPPAQSCLSFILNDMNASVIAGSPNNFQMVSALGNNRFNISYGREFFYIDSFVSNADGKIVHAEMYNQLDLKIKNNCDGDYQGCQVETSSGEVRKLKLELLN